MFDDDRSDGSRYVVSVPGTVVRRRTRTGFERSPGEIARGAKTLRGRLDEGPVKPILVVASINRGQISRGRIDQRLHRVLPGINYAVRKVSIEGEYRGNCHIAAAEVGFALHERLGGVNLDLMDATFVAYRAEGPFQTKPWQSSAIYHCIGVLSFPDVAVSIDATYPPDKRINAGLIVRDTPQEVLAAMNRHYGPCGSSGFKPLKELMFQGGVYRMCNDPSIAERHGF
jgi:hypothetical protein